MGFGLSTSLEMGWVFSLFLSPSPSPWLLSFKPAVISTMTDRRAGSHLEGSGVLPPAPHRPWLSQEVHLGRNNSWTVEKPVCSPVCVLSGGGHPSF